MPNLFISFWKPKNGLDSYTHPLIKDSHLYFKQDRHHGPWICGGAARKICFGLPIDTDIDIYFQSHKQYELFLKKMEQAKIAGDDISVQGKSQWAESWLWNGITVQLITFQFFATLNDVLDDFDITVAQFGFDGWNSYSPYDSYEDEEKKLIKFHKLTRPMQAMRRIIKYSKQGYHLDDFQTLHFFKRILASGKLSDSDNSDQFKRVTDPNELVWLGEAKDKDLEEYLDSIGITPARLCFCTDSYSQEIEIEFKDHADKNLFLLNKPDKFKEFKGNDVPF
jgi:hypothetical protein